MDKINFEKMFCTTHETGPYNAVIYVMCVCVCGLGGMQAPSPHSGI